MFALFYLLSIVAVALVIHWLVQNDGKADSEPTIGLLRMRAPTRADAGENIGAAQIPQASGAVRATSGAQKVR
jgi:hypothetical protein